MMYGATVPRVVYCTPGRKDECISLPSRVNQSSHDINLRNDQSFNY